MKVFNRKRYYRHSFDFELGYLVKSPCKTCEHHEKFPKCIDVCETIYRIQNHLADSVSCSKGFGSLEGFAETKEGWEGK